MANLARKLRASDQGHYVRHAIILCCFKTSIRYFAVNETETIIFIRDFCFKKRLFSVIKDAFRQNSVSDKIDFITSSFCAIIKGCNSCVFVKNIKNLFEKKFFNIVDIFSLFDMHFCFLFWYVILFSYFMILSWLNLTFLPYNLFTYEYWLYIMVISRILLSERLQLIPRNR